MAAEAATTTSTTAAAAAAAAAAKEEKAVQKFNKKVCEMLDAQDASHAEAELLEALDLTPPNIPRITGVIPVALHACASDSLCTVLSSRLQFEAWMYWLTLEVCKHSEYLQWR